MVVAGASRRQHQNVVEVVGAATLVKFERNAAAEKRSSLKSRIPR